MGWRGYKRGEEVIVTVYETDLWYLNGLDLNLSVVGSKLAGRHRIMTALFGVAHKSSIT